MNFKVSPADKDGNYPLLSDPTKIIPAWLVETNPDVIQVIDPAAVWVPKDNELFWTVNAFMDIVQVSADNYPATTIAARGFYFPTQQAASDWLAQAKALITYPKVGDVLAAQAAQAQPVAPVADPTPSK